MEEVVICPELSDAQKLQIRNAQMALVAVDEDIRALTQQRDKAYESLVETVSHILEDVGANRETMTFDLRTLTLKGK